MTTVYLILLKQGFYMGLNHIIDPSVCVGTMTRGSVDYQRHQVALLGGVCITRKVLCDCSMALEAALVATGHRS